MSLDNRARTQWRTTLALVLTGAIVALFGLAAPTGASSPPSHNASASSGHSSGFTKMRGTTDDGRHFKGTFSPTSFDVVGSTITATGDVKGWIVGKGHAKRVPTQEVTTQVLSMNGTDLTNLTTAGASRVNTSSFTSVASTSTAGFVPAAAACPILSLVLGPLDLDLLGLQVHLDQVVLDIVAQSGAGNLLGNLLCAVAGLLDGPSPLAGLLTQLTDLLNQILGVLGGLSV